MSKFYLRSKIYFGDDSLKALAKLKKDKAVIFTDKFMNSSGNADHVASLMTGCRNVSVYSDIVPDPPIELIVEALRFILKEEAEIVVALGGGSVIDAAKATLLMYHQKTGTRIPLVAIPTTSGTGSEVTKFSVITDNQEEVKYPLVSDELLPDMAILSADFTMSVPANITADTGFDVITHAFEAYVSTEASDFTDAFAEKAFELCFEYLPRAVKNGHDREAREKMHSASCLAGMAFNEAGLGINHSIAHGLGALFHIPHGRANAMILPHVMAFNAEIDINRFGGEPSRVCEKMAKLARNVGLPAFSAKQGASNLVSEIRRMSRELGIPQSLSEAGVSLKDYESKKEHIIIHALKDACTATNPRKADAAGIAQVLRGIEK